MQGIHTLAQPPNSRADTHLQRAEKKNRNKLFQNCTKTQPKQKLQIGLNTPFQDWDLFILPSQQWMCFDKNLQKDLPRFAPRNCFTLLFLSSDFPVHSQKIAETVFISQMQTATNLVDYISWLVDYREVQKLFLCNNCYRHELSRLH